MVRKRAYRAVALVCLTAASFSVAPSPATAQLSGDPEAIALVRRMLDMLGGQETWAQARSIYVELLGHYAPESDPWMESYWIDLEVPRGRYEIRAGESERVIAWTLDGGWESRDGVVEPQSEERHDLEHAYWVRELTVIFRRLAAGSPASRLALDAAPDGTRTITIIDAGTGEAIADLTLNAAAQPIRWSATILDESHERVLGPLEEYDGLRLPEWGATPSCTLVSPR